MSLSASLQHLRLPVICAPMFIVSNPALVAAQCKSGIVGSFPALNARGEGMLDKWLTDLQSELAADKAAGGTPAPFAVNQIVHPSNTRLVEDITVCLKHQVPVFITSLQAPPKALVDGAKAPGPDEIILPLKQLKGRWVLVTDAYFFPEGQGSHFAKGRFGDFRVLPGGRALLVGLADDQKQEIQPLPGGSIWDWRPAAERLDEQQRGQDASDSEPAARVVEERAAEQAPSVEVEATVPPPPPSVSRP